ncbi:MAG: hypothetical protein QM811_29210 [Pirellulales bacterium]
MSSDPYDLIPKPIELPPRMELRNPGTAALLAWLIPGAGHFYQGRWAKGLLYSFCILGTFIYGILLGGDRTVYASMRQYDKRYAYLFQVGVGAPASPARSKRRSSARTVRRCGTGSWLRRS